MGTSFWRLDLIGMACLREAGSASRRVELGAKDAALLAFAALGGPVSGERLASLLWPSVDRQRASNSLRQRLHRLRRATSARLLELTDRVVLADDLHPEPTLPLHTLELDPGACDGQILSAHDYADMTEFCVWLAALREQHVNARRNALARIATSAETAGDLDRALVYARHLLSAEPVAEHAHRRVMRLHYLRGDRASAVAAFEACEAVLKDELGLRPSPETLQLLSTVERSAVLAGAAVSTVPAALLKPPRTVGRDAARARLAQAHADGDVLVLVGEAGMGKSRLLHDFVATHPLTVYVQARPGDAGVPYGLLARLLNRVSTLLPGSLDGSARSTLGAVVASEPSDSGFGRTTTSDQIACAMVALLGDLAAAGWQRVVVDDLHFADRASVEMLRSLIAGGEPQAICWVLAHRPPEPQGGDANVLQSIEDLDRVRWVIVEPLDRIDLADLIRSLELNAFDAEPLAANLLRHTGGNPLFVLETLRAMLVRSGSDPALAPQTLPRPVSIERLIDRRLQRLSEPALALGRVAALAGADFTPELAEHALATPVILLAGAWAELEAADVLRGTAFAHDLVHDAMLRATPHAVARHAQSLIATFLEQRGVEPARVAAHWLAGGEHLKAALGLRLAAARARLAGRVREEVALLLQSADAFEQAGEAAAAITERANALQPMMYVDGLVAARAFGDGLITRVGNGPLAGMVLARLASFLMHAGDAVEAELAARRALDCLTPEQNTLRMQALAALALACLARGRAEEALELLQPCVNRVDQVDDLRLRIEFCSAHTVVLYHLGRLDEASRALEKQFELTRESGDRAELLATLVSLGSLELRRGLVARALRATRDAVDALVEQDKPSVVSCYIDCVAGSALCADGVYDEGLQTLAAACETLGRIHPGTIAHASSEAAMAEVLLQIGQTARAQKLVLRDHSALVAGPRARWLLLRAELERVLGQRQGAAVDPQLIDAAREGGDYWSMMLQIEQARRAEPAQAIELCDLVMAKARRNGDHVIATHAATVRLEALGTAGSDEAAGAAAFELELQLQACRSTLIYPPEVWLACFRAHMARHRVDAAGLCLARAADWIRRVALPNVPDAYRESFLGRHRCNLAVQAEVGRWNGPTLATFSARIAARSN